MAKSPYDGKDKKQWSEITQTLLDAHPLAEDDIQDVVLMAWKSIFASSIGRHALKIGEHIFTKPQIIDALLHELIPAELAAAYPEMWRAEEAADEKDIVCLENIFTSTAYLRQQKLCAKNYGGQKRQRRLLLSCKF